MNLSDSFHLKTPVDVGLSIWVEMQRKDSVRTIASLHYRGADSICRSDAAADSEEQAESADRALGEEMEKHIFDMEAIHQWAICKRCGISRVWRFPERVFADVLSEAERQLEQRMRRGTLTSCLFQE